VGDDSSLALVECPSCARIARKPTAIDPLLTAWQQALGPGKGEAAPGEEEIEADSAPPTHHWRRKRWLGRGSPGPGLPGALTHRQKGAEALGAAASACRPRRDPSLKSPGGGRSGRLVKPSLQLGEINVQPSPANLLLEGLGPGGPPPLQVFEPGSGRGLDAAQPLADGGCAPAEAFVLVRTAAARLRDVGVGRGAPTPASAGGLAAGWAVDRKRSCRRITGASASAKPWVALGPELIGGVT